MREKIIELSKKESLSNKDKNSIKTLCAENGIEVTFKSGCPNCYQDALALLRFAFGITAADVNGVETKSKKYDFVCKHKKIEYYNNGAWYVLDGTSKDEEIEEFIKAVPNQQFYKLKN